jgi:hypothetical protein
VATRDLPASPLLTPSLTQARRLDRVVGERPWRIQSQFFLAFYGGALPLTWIAYRNAARLGLPRQVQIRIAVTGAVTMLLMIALAVVLLTNRSLLIAYFGGWTQPRMISRLLFRAGGIALYLVFAAWQKPGDRLYTAFGTGEYDSLWRPGLIATVVADVLLILVLIPLLLAFA